MPLFHKGGIVPKEMPTLRPGHVPIPIFDRLDLLYPHQREVIEQLTIPKRMLTEARPSRREPLTIQIRFDAAHLHYDGPIFKEPVGAYAEMVENIDRVELTPASRAKRTFGYQMKKIRQNIDQYLAKMYLNSLYGHLASPISDFNTRAKGLAELSDV